MEKDGKEAENNSRQCSKIIILAENLAGNWKPERKNSNKKYHV